MTAGRDSESNNVCPSSPGGLCLTGHPAASRRGLSTSSVRLTGVVPSQGNLRLQPPSMIADIRQSAQVTDSPEVRLLHTVRSQGIVTYPASKDDATV